VSKTLRTRTLMIVACFIVMPAAALVPSGAGLAEPPETYVALGDSYVAGPLIVPHEGPSNCLRSSQNYPHQVATSLALALRDASCSGATTEDMTTAQDENPPQFDALDASTTIVTIGIGGNDIGFTEIAENCASPVPFGTPCQDRYVVNGVDTLQQRIDETAPKVAAVLRGIHERAPSAAVFVVGYPAILPEDSGAQCWPLLPITEGDVPYLREVTRNLNRMLEEQAAANGATFVSLYEPSIGHDACQPPLPDRRWVEPVVPASPAAPIHPNLAGMTGAAGVVAAAIT
jgi:lysophospholipase L1-like esterase